MTASRSEVHITFAGSLARELFDVCAEHGTWFDAGELETVMRAYRHQRARGASRVPAPPSATPLDDLLADSFRPA